MRACIRACVHVCVFVCVCVCVCVRACIDAKFSTSTFMSDDDNRVVLKPMDGHPDCQRDFINASYIHVSSIQFIMF